MEFIDAAIQDYAEQFSSPEPDLLLKLAEETRANIPVPQMLSGHLQGRLLSLFSRMLRPKQILEVGTYTGYASLCMAEGLQKDGKLHTIDINADLKQMLERYIRLAGMENNIVPHTGDALQVIPKLEGPFDLVFLDAHKPEYCDYFDLVIDKVPSGGLIIADNVLWSGHVLEPNPDEDTKGLMRYVQKIRDDDRVFQVLLPIRDGLMLARKK